MHILKMPLFDIEHLTKPYIFESKRHSENKCETLAINTTEGNKTETGV